MKPALVPLLALCLLGSFPASVRAKEPPSGIKDGGKRFRAQTVAQANEKIRALQTKTDLELFIETVDSLHESQRRRNWFLSKFRSLNENKILDRQARKRAEEAGVRGVYVVTSADPPDVRVVTWPAEYERSFNDQKREQLRKFLARRLGKDRDEDAALLEAIDEFQRLVESPAPPEGISSLTLALLVAGFLGVWVLLLLLRVRLVTEPLDYRPALLGAMFGVIPGFWVYDKLFQMIRAAPGKLEPILPPAQEEIVPPPEPQEGEPAVGENAENAPV
jgi:hypothetical protein